MSSIYSHSINLDWESDSLRENIKGLESLRFLFHPAKISFVIDDATSEDFLNIVNIYKRKTLLGEFLPIGVNSGHLHIKIKKESADILFFTSSYGSLKKALKMKLFPTKERNKIKVQAKLMTFHLAALFKNQAEFENRSQFSREIKKLMEILLEI